MTRSKTIVVAGAGVTGAETAGELAFEYGQEKEIILVGLSRREIWFFIMLRALNNVIR